MLELYHSGLTQASVKVRLTLKEKGLDYKSHFLRLPAGDHLTPEYLAINPDGQVPALVHDGVVVTETTVINEYIDDVWPEPALSRKTPTNVSACGSGPNGSTTKSTTKPPLSPTE